jgi:two-component system, chemotaxis family, protein-glutamate methylesterase/glutaminase
MKHASADTIHVLVVDDSAVVRQLMTNLLTDELGFHVTTASDPLIAMSKMRRHAPHVILLDLEMPRMHGLTFLRRIVAGDPVPVVVCSGYAVPGTKLALRALEAGAVDIALKPRVSASGAIDDNGLVDIVRAAALARLGTGRARLAAAPEPASGADPPRARSATPLVAVPAIRGRGDLIVAMGASTGGTEALKEVLRAMPPDAPGIVIVQHMPAGFTAAFAEHLNGMCRIRVSEARSGDRVEPGHALVAPGNRHLVVRQRGAYFDVDVTDDPPVSRHRPSVDVLFRSVARAAGPRAVGVIMTGMGADGAEGLLELKRAGGTTIAQDESTSVVFGMPKEAIDRGAAEVVLPLPRIASGILQRLPAAAAKEAQGK